LLTEDREGVQELQECEECAQIRVERAFPRPRDEARLDKSERG
jgi:hypothetical protein